MALKESIRDITGDKKQLLLAVGIPPSTDISSWNCIPLLTAATALPASVNKLMQKQKTTTCNR